MSLYPSSNISSSVLRSKRCLSFSSSSSYFNNVSIISSGYDGYCDTSLSLLLLTGSYRICALFSNYFQYSSSLSSGTVCWCFNASAKTVISIFSRAILNLLSLSKNTGPSLTSCFGGVGTSIGDLVTLNYSQYSSSLSSGAMYSRFNAPIKMNISLSLGVYLIVLSLSKNIRPCILTFY